MHICWFPCVPLKVEWQFHGCFPCFSSIASLAPLSLSLWCLSHSHSYCPLAEVSVLAKFWRRLQQPRWRYCLACRVGFDCKGDASSETNWLHLIHSEVSHTKIALRNSFNLYGKKNFNGKKSSGLVPKSWTVNMYSIPSSDATNCFINTPALLLQWTKDASSKPQCTQRVSKLALSS